MRLFARLANLRRQRQAKHAPRPPRGPTRGGLTRAQWMWLAVCLLLAAGGTLAVFHFFIWNKVPADLVGTWVVQGGPMSGGTFEFAPDGAMEMRHEGADVGMKGRVTVHGKTLQTITYNRTTQREESHRSTIRELTS